MIRPEVEALHRALREQTEAGELDADSDCEIDGYRLRLAPLVDAVLAAQWRPIETAPKDETLILLFDPAKGVNTGRYDRLNGWMAMPGAYNRKPSHWQPLGRPPA